MDADWLRSRLESGRSIESIAHEAGKAPSTVAYWVNKHGLTSTHAVRHVARGAIAREVLEELMAEGLTIRAMAQRLDRSYSTVRHWLARYGLATPRAVRLAETAPARGSGAETVDANCPVHGVTTFIAVAAMASAAGSAAWMRWIAAVARSSATWSPKPEARARSAVMTAPSRRCSSIISIPRRRASRLPRAG